MWGSVASPCTDTLCEARASRAPPPGQEQRPALSSGQPGPRACRSEAGSRTARGAPEVSRARRRMRFVTLRASEGGLCHALPYAGPPLAREPGPDPRLSQVAHPKFYRNLTTFLQRLYDTRLYPLLYSPSWDLRLIDHGGFAEEVREHTPATACPTHSPSRGKSARTPPALAHLVPLLQP